MRIKLVTLALLVFALLAQPVPARAQTIGDGPHIQQAEIIRLHQDGKRRRPHTYPLQMGRYSSQLNLCVSCRVRNPPE